jgi:hypothetical protein
MSQEESQVFRSGSHEEAAATEGRNKKKKAKQDGPTDARHLHDAQDGPSDRREMHDAEGVIDGRHMHDAEGVIDGRPMLDADGPSVGRNMHDAQGAIDGRHMRDAEGPSDGRNMHDAQGAIDGRHMHDAEGPTVGHAEVGIDSVEDLLAWAGVQGPVNPRNMQDAEGPSNKRDMHDGEGPSDQRSLQDHYVTIDSKTVERRTVELGKRIDPSMADPQQAAAQVKKEPLFTMADATPWSLSLRLEARLKDVGSKTSDIHNQIDRLEVDALNLGKRIKI